MLTVKLKLVKDYIGCDGCFFLEKSVRFCHKKREQRKCFKDGVFYIYTIQPKRF